MCDICTYGLRTDVQLSQEAFCIQCFIVINLSREVAVTSKFGRVLVNNKVNIPLAVESGG